MELKYNGHEGLTVKHSKMINFSWKMTVERNKLTQIN